MVIRRDARGIDPADLDHVLATHRPDLVALVGPIHAPKQRQGTERKCAGLVFLVALGIDQRLFGPFDCAVQTRYKATPIPCTVTPDSNNPESFSLVFHEPQRSVTPGQWAVLYDGDTVLAAGIIG